MSSDSSDTTPSTNPLDVAVEGLVIRPDAFDTPVATANGSDRKTMVAPALAAVAREKADLSLTATQVFPLWALIPIIGVVLAAGSFLGANMALGPNVKGYDYALQFPDGAELGAGMAVDEYDPKIWLAKGKGEYATVCASCHQATGEGVPGQFPPLKNSEWVIGGEERATSILLHGIVGPLQVNGKSYNGAMPAQGALKNNKSIAQLISYVRNEGQHGIRRSGRGTPQKIVIAHRAIYRGRTQGHPGRCQPSPFQTWFGGTCGARSRRYGSCGRPCSCNQIA